MMRKQRRRVPVNEQAKAAEAVAERLFSLAALQKPTTVFTYLAARHELPTRPLIERLLTDGHTVAVPFTKDDGLMFPRVLRSFDDLVEGYFGIPTSAGPPLGESPAITMVPALAFDRVGNRVGYGGGYYDRFLSANPKTISIGLGYDFQLLDQLPAEGFDVPLTMVITPSELLTPAS